jgi:hypothetical protein
LQITLGINAGAAGARAFTVVAVYLISVLSTTITTTAGRTYLWSSLHQVQAYHTYQWLEQYVKEGGKLV